MEVKVVTKKSVTKKQLLRVAPWEQYADQELTDVVNDISINTARPVRQEVTPDVVPEEVPTGCICFGAPWMRRRSSENKR